MKLKLAKPTKKALEKHNTMIEDIIDFVKNGFTWEVLGEIPSMKNDLRISRRGGFYHKDNAVKKYKQSFAWQTPAKFRMEIIRPVVVTTVIFMKDRRKDCHNLQAVIFDSLEAAGVICNDRQIVKWNGEALIDRENPRVVITVKEIEVMK